MMLQALIFGLDGVLAETHEARRIAHNTVFSEAGLAWHWDRELYARLLKTTGGDDMIGAFVRSRVASYRQTNDLQQLVSVMSRRQASIYQDLLEAGAVQMRPGVARVLQAAEREGLRLAIASRDSSLDISNLLKTCLGEKAASAFEVISSRGDSRDGIGTNVHARALGMLSLSPRACLAIESSAYGMSSASAAGIPSLVTWGLYPQLQDCGDALLATEDPSLPATFAVLARWDCGSPAEVLGLLKRVHLAQTKCSGELSSILSAPWPIANKELDHVGVRHLEN